ncbi:DNA helicase [Knoellia sinensis KCTC 19936]|uniref:DNA helicase n=1 Tax=Knoellia sinensis KCTC 19936 TaxID=1385520 RepID=A0A0A0J252_9MICO|nr:AAA domain-containing protein [Knoellia sinensis]KGN30227.1 DNA helicase [Knoellia sinensis KCTC 19936]
MSETGPQSEIDSRTERVRHAVEGWTKHLVDLGGRNTLLWYRDLPSGTLDLSTAHPGGVAMLLAGRPTRLSDLVREPAAFDEARRRARTIAGKSRELREERGIDTGFVAVGMATWSLGRGRTATAARQPAAPVLLRSCTLRPTTPQHDDYELDLGDEIEFNPVLEHYLASEQGIVLDSEQLEGLAHTSNGFDPYPTYHALVEACASVPAFEIAPRIVLGTFSYAKLPMVADLAAHGDALADHDVIAALAGDPTALRSVRHELEPRPADSIPDPAQGLLVLDADSSQQEAIEAARSGAHLVIHGPPGTGKSQTIANLVSALAADGKRVLFVAEKRAAIDAVVGRLDRIGLGDLVLDLHDGARGRRRIASEFADALPGRTPKPADPPSRDIDRLRAAAATLREHRDAMHEPRRPWGVSVHDIQEAISALGSVEHPPHSRVRIRGEALQSLPRDRYEDLTRELTRVASLGAWRTDHGSDPWYGATVRTPDDAVRARELVERWSGSRVDEVGSSIADVFSGLRLPQARTVRDWGRILDTVGRVRDTLETFRPEIFDVPLGDFVAATGTTAYRSSVGSNLGWWERLSLKRQVRRLVRPGRPPADLHAALVEANEQRSAWKQMAGAGGRPEMPAELDRAADTYAGLASDLEWLDERVPSSSSERVSLLDVPRDELSARLQDLADAPDRLAVVPSIIGPVESMHEAGLGALIEDLASRGVPAEDVASEADFVWWSSVLDDIALRDARVGAHDGEDLRRTVSEFAAADREVLRQNASRVRAAVRANVDRVLGDSPELESLLRAEGAKSRRHRPLRDLLPAAGELLTATRPCWVMSPLVVASVLPPGVWFDVVVFDEASQIPPAEAVSAISRARQVVLAGDSRQLPPTSFFTTAHDEGDASPDDALTEGVESILDVLAATLPSRRLSWHYRSQDERLISFANQQVYDGSLVTFPGTGRASVLRHELVDGAGVVTDGAGSVETTQAEVDRVIELVLEHARVRPGETLGVIALGLAHTQRLDDALRRALVNVDAPTAAFFAEDVHERFFIKNLERVQGDERDAIILSVGYGKTAHGRVLHRFGPLNMDGGERRLNVAITRAKKRMTVVSSISADELDPQRLKARGALMLRDYLAHAAAGTAEAHTAGKPTAAAAASEAESSAGVPGAGAAGAAAPGPAASDSAGHSVVMAEFARRLRAGGLVVHERYGASADPIDLAVEDPNHRGRLAVAVESDGPEYAAMPHSRDRDRLRAEHLGRLGWQHVRVWTRDAFRDPARDVARIRALAERGGGGS